MLLKTFELTVFQRVETICCSSNVKRLLLFLHSGNPNSLASFLSEDKGREVHNICHYAMPAVVLFITVIGVCGFGRSHSSLRQGERGDCSAELVGRDMHIK